MTVGIEVVVGTPSAEEAAAVTAAVQVMLEAELDQAVRHVPWPYRSAWRRTAIDEGIRGADVS